MKRVLRDVCCCYRHRRKRDAGSIRTAGGCCHQGHPAAAGSAHCISGRADRRRHAVWMGLGLDRSRDCPWDGAYTIFGRMRALAGVYRARCKSAREQQFAQAIVGCDPRLECLPAAAGSTHRLRPNAGFRRIAGRAIRLDLPGNSRLSPGRFC